MVIETIQLAVFVGDAPPVPALEFAREVLPDLSPKQFQELGPGQTVARFEEGEYQITVAANPLRYDIVFSALGGDIQLEPVALNTETVRSAKLSTVAAFAEKIGSRRLAAIVNASTYASTSKATVDLFSPSTKQISLPKGTTEIDFKLNVPRQSRSVRDLLINRLHRWFTTGMVLMAISPQGSSPTNQGWLLKEQMDVNSDAESQFPRGTAKGLLEELLDEAISQMGKGPDGLEDSGDAR